MGVITYYPKGGAQTFGIATYVPVGRNMMWIVGHGLGECGDGSQTALQKVMNWGNSFAGGWVDMKEAADTYGIVLVFVNTTSASAYSSGEYTFTLNWALALFTTIPESKTWMVGHSLGWRGLGMYFFTSLTLANRVAGTINSASGPYTDNAALYSNMVSAANKYWGVTATNDTTQGTSPVYTRRVYDKMKAISSSARAIVSEFPTGTWSSDTAHSAVLTKLTRDPIEVTASITRGLTAGLPILMNLYQWCLSNPRGSTYKAPTVAYSAPVVPPPATNVPILNINWDISRKIGLLAWADGITEYIKGTTANPILNVFERKDSNKNLLIDVKFQNLVTKKYGPYRKSS